MKIEKLNLMGISYWGGDSLLSLKLNICTYVWRESEREGVFVLLGNFTHPTIFTNFLEIKWDGVKKVFSSFYPHM